MKNQYIQPITVTNGLDAQHVMSGSNTVKSTAVSNTPLTKISGGAPQRIGKNYL